MIRPLAFIQETYVELKQVKWPTRAEVIRLTAIVVIISVTVGLYIGGLDLVFAKAFEYLIK